MLSHESASAVHCVRRALTPRLDRAFLYLSPAYKLKLVRDDFTWRLDLLAVFTNSIVNTINYVNLPKELSKENVKEFEKTCAEWLDLPGTDSRFGF